LHAATVPSRQKIILFAVEYIPVIAPPTLTAKCPCPHAKSGEGESVPHAKVGEGESVPHAREERAQAECN